MIHWRQICSSWESECNWRLTFLRLTKLSKSKLEETLYSTSKGRLSRFVVGMFVGHGILTLTMTRDSRDRLEEKKVQSKLKLKETVESKTSNTNNALKDWTV
jgi:hypothetical protein